MNKYFGYAILASIIVFFTVLIAYYVKYWIQLKRACKQLEIEWPIPSQRELTKRIIQDFSEIQKVYIAPFKMLKIIFFPPTKDPILMEPIKGIRRCWAALILFPFLLAFALVMIFLLTY